MKPLVSVVMSVQDEAASLSRCLGALDAQEWDSEQLEVLVAEGGSRDDTRLQLEAWAAESSRHLVIDNSFGTASIGLNLALAQARGEIFIRMDGHAVPDSAYVRTCVEALDRTHSEMVGGHMDPVGHGHFGRAVALMMKSNLGSGGARYRNGSNEGATDTVYLGAWPRSTLEKFGLFDEEMIRNQDDELSARIRKGNGRVHLCPNLKVRYSPRTTMTSLGLQYFRYGCWKVRGLQKHPLGYPPRLFAPPLLLAVMGTTWLLHTPTAIVLGSAYLGSILFSALLTTAKAGEPHLWPATSVALATAHLAYGVGFLVGLVRFLPRWVMARRGATPPLLERNP